MSWMLSWGQWSWWSWINDFDDEGVEDWSKSKSGTCRGRSVVVLHYDCVAAKHLRYKMTTKELKLTWFTEGWALGKHFFYTTHYLFKGWKQIQSKYESKYRPVMSGCVKRIYCISSLICSYCMNPSLLENLLVFDIILYILKFSWDQTLVNM